MRRNKEKVYVSLFLFSPGKQRMIICIIQNKSVSDGALLTTQTANCLANKYFFAAIKKNWGSQMLLWISSKAITERNSMLGSDLVTLWPTFQSPFSVARHAIQTCWFRRNEQQMISISIPSRKWQSRVRAARSRLHVVIYDQLSEIFRCINWSFY